MTLHKQISNWILDYLKTNNLKTLVIGISGGIDSAVASTLCAMTGYSTKLLVMPIYQNNLETHTTWHIRSQKSALLRGWNIPHCP